MTLAPRVNMADSEPAAPAARQGGVLLGEDWVAPEAATDPTLRAKRRRRGVVSLNTSPLARKIVVFNLLALLVMVAGVLFLNPFRDSLVLQREAALVTEAKLVAQAVEARLPAVAGPVQNAPTQAAVAALTLARIEVSQGTILTVYDRNGQSIARVIGQAEVPAPPGSLRNTFMTDLLNAVWSGVSQIVPGQRGGSRGLTPEALEEGLLGAAREGRTSVRAGEDSDGRTLFSVATPILRDGMVLGVVSVTSAAGELDQLVRNEREQVLRMFVIALLVSIALSLVLASTIANPLSDLAAAAELGHDRNARKMAPGRVRIPDLTARPDEIGRLSGALRGMVAALYDRIEANEQFAADVAHEIKNPLASLRSAIGSLRVVKKEEHRTRLLEVIEHDVRRLDRLVSDISNASRLDSELVKEEEEEFNLIRTISNVNQYLGQQAAEKGVDFITDLPAEPILIHGLEGRLAQVFVNLITNAISFCEDGDAVRVWVRRRDNRVLVVVEDTGPGIPEQALGKIFKRFYSDRPATHFGNNSGLGLSISKQIVEAHGGVIWAENIRPTEDDATSAPLGARFVVGLPI
jgi:two-component system, OmpR family, sensor histidine kinase ChvG